MGFRVNNNIEALNAQRNMATSSGMFAKSVERLSSGLRINRAGDDAAGLSVSEKLRAQVRGLNQASRNAQDGISMIQTAEGALNEVHSMMQRMRELAVQASNDTLSSNDRASIDAELQALSSEIDGTASRTKFNGQSLLTGSLVTSLGGATATDLVVGDTITTTGGNATATAISVTAAQAGKTYTLTAPTATTLTLTRSGDSVAQTITVGALGANGSATLAFSNLGVSITLQADSGGKTAAGIVTDLTAAANDTIVTTAGTGSANLQIGANATDFMSVAFSEVKLAGATALSAMANLDTALTTFNGAQTVANAQDLVTKVDLAIDYVSTTRGTLGANQNRLEHTIANLGVAAENIQASESRIRDADVAAETVQFTKAQILQQAGVAILAQANQAPQSVLSLLK